MDFKRTDNLSPTMTETLQLIQEHGKLIRYDGGFWSWKDAAQKPLYNGGKLLCMVPVWHCDVKTLRALEKRGLVVLDEKQKICLLHQEII